MKPSITVRKAVRSDLEVIHRIQVEAFAPLLEKYRDVETNPAAEPFERVVQRFEMVRSDYRLVLLDDEIVGAIRVVTDESGSTGRISPMFIRPSFQGRGIGRRALELTEAAYPDVRRWELDTIREESALCRFYEAAGYAVTGDEEILKPGMTIVFYCRET